MEAFHFLHFVLNTVAVCGIVILYMEVCALRDKDK